MASKILALILFMVALNLGALLCMAAGELVPARAAGIGVAALDLISAFALLALYQNDFRARLKMVVENAERLPKGLPLRKPISGNDELALLDRALHDAARDLRHMSEHRRSLMEMVAHDLRSPLAAAQVSLEILNSQKLGSLEPRQQQQLDAARRNVQRTVGLVNDLLTVDRLEAGKLELTRKHTDVSSIVNEAVQSVTPLARLKNIEIRTQVVERTVDADQQRMIQVLVNLLANALHFSPQNTEIHVRATDEKDGVRIEVKDSGPGLATDAQTQLFDKFYQASGKSKIGFGLGLSICKHIVRLHGGNVGVESELAQGSTFWFTIPKA